MAFATRSRRATRAQPTWTVVPFDARGAGIGEIPATIAIETPHNGETLLVLCAEAERPDSEAMRRCLLALDAFRAGYDAAGPGTLTTALIAGMEEANAALYSRDRRAPRGGHRPVGVGLTALVAQHGDAYVIQAGPGQALIVGAEGIIAVPPFTRYGALGSLPHDERSAPAPPLGTLPQIEPDLFHIDAHDGLFAVLCVSALGRVLHHEDDAPLRALDPAGAGEYLVSLGVRYRLPEAFGVIVSTEGSGIPHVVSPDTRSLWPAPAADNYTAPHPPDAFAEEWSADPSLPPASSCRTRDPYAFPAVPPQSAIEPEEQRWDYLGEPAHTAVPGPTRTGGWRDRLNGRRAAAWDDPYRPARTLRLPALPPRLWVLLGGVVLTLILAGLIGIVHAEASHRANSATIHELDGIATARGQAVALRDSQAAYAALATLQTQLDRVAAEERQTKRVTVERQQLGQALDTVGAVIRVKPQQVAMLPHFDGAPGNHRLLLAGDDGKLSLFDRDKNDWGVYAVDPATQKVDRLFATGNVANKVPAGELRGLFWLNGPATTDRTRLFGRTASGSWGELAIPATGDKRPTAIALLGDSLYLLDNTAGQIIRLPLANGGTVKPWTNDAAAAELRTAVDMTSDGQTIWVLLADGRVRAIVGGTPAQLIAPAAIPPMKEPTAITTSAASPYLYIADGAQARIVRVRKADGRVVQVLRAADGSPPIPAISEPHGG